ncbi:MAG: CO dehydrogenase/CO-methylating acetyl-CoA synthase complex subunit beta, partial [Candidatus Subteraquimicrobiales bacterium]|nr:CO dehydrogenase/CO-methylating acetyl-CoA synthase complex subunit beta [Candidatus Subteraquimicrobiales bacterium]
RKEDCYLEIGGGKTHAFELLRMKDMNEIADGKIKVFGPEITDLPEDSQAPIGIMVSVAGRKMQEDFEPILERQMHHFINGAEGVLHLGQRDIIWMRISKGAKAKGFKLHHLGGILKAKLVSDYPSIVDKVQVDIYTEPEKVDELLAEARKIYAHRDERVAGMTDESVDIFYSCTLCQSFAPNHVCVISPERLGLCGAYNWLDGKAAYEIKPTGPNQPVVKGETIDAAKGQWKGINEFVYQASHHSLERFNAYSMMEDPMTSCGCFECIVAILPLCNGVMVVNREYPGMTPSGMKFSTLAGSVGGGVQTPGFIGVGKQYLVSKKFISAEGSFKRIAWMPKALKDSMYEQLKKRAEEIGAPDFVDKIADETVAVTEEEVMNHMVQVGHPALEMSPMF